MLVLFLYILVSGGNAFNIDTKTPYIIYGNVGEYFGFSVALHKTGDSRKLLVGAPKAQTSQPGVDFGGTVYQCTIPDNIDRARPVTQCTSRVMAFDDNGNKFLYIDPSGEAARNADGSRKYNYEGQGYMQENKTGQWLGVSLKSTGSKVVACAHRYIRVANNYRKGTYDTPPIGKCVVVSGDLEELETEYTPCWSDATGYEMTSCQAGTSVDMTDDTLVFGGPGANHGEGKAYMSIDLTSSTTFLTENQDEGGVVGQWYTGYSTVICDVNGDGKDDLITAAPRAESYKGKMFVYNRNSGVLNRQKTIDGNQIGEYFGYSIDCGDVNNDGFKDVIVGAPYYSKDTSGQARLQATGRVYIYYGSRENYLDDKPTIIEGDIYERALFGHSVKNVGDLNGDGYEDVLVGAPYNSNGIVYLYLGSAKGLETEYSQGIRPGDLSIQADMTGFGWSIDGGVDLDDNSYPDILVGTMDGYATYLRSLPIIHLKAEIVISPDTPIDTTNENLKVDVPDNPTYKAVAVDIKICFTYKSGIVDGASQSIDVNYTLTSDYKNPKGFRMYFKPSRDDLKSQTLLGRTTVSTDSTKTCTKTFKAYFNGEIYDFRHVYMKLEADVKDTPVFSNRVVLNQQMIDDAEKRVVMQSGCTKPSGVCQADLVLAPVDYTISPEGWDQIAIRRTDFIVFNINVTNKGDDDAFLSELSVILPRNIIFNRRQAIGDLTEESISHIKCITKQQEDFTNKVICALSTELKVGVSEIFGLSVITTNIESISPKELKFEFNAYVQEPSEELSTLLDDNSRTVMIGVGYPAGIELRGRPLRERQPYSNDKEYVNAEAAKSIGPDVRHELEVSISDTAQWDEFNNIKLLVKWPMYKFDTDEFLLYLVNVSIEDDTPGNSRCISDGQINPLGVEDNTKQRRSADGEPVDGSPQNCKEADCVQFYCEIDKLAKGDTLKFVFMARLWESTLFNVANINITSYVAVVDVEQQNFVFGPEGKSAMKSQFYPSSATKRSYLWIIIGSIIAGILLLVLLVILLWKCGFFKRKAPPTHRPEAHADAGGG